MDQEEGEEILDLMVSNQNWILAQDANDPCSIFDIYTSILSTDNAGILSISTFIMSLRTFIFTNISKLDYMSSLKILILSDIDLIHTFSEIGLSNGLINYT